MFGPVEKLYGDRYATGLVPALIITLFINTIHFELYQMELSFCLLDFGTDRLNYGYAQNKKATHNLIG